MNKKITNLSNAMNMAELTNGLYILTADIGGSLITAAVCNVTTNIIINKSLTHVEINSKGPAESILKSWQNAFDTALGQSGGQVSGLGMAMPDRLFTRMVQHIKGPDKYISFILTKTSYV